MLWLDPRKGSGDLAPALRQLNVPLTVEELPFGDAQIIGNGPEGRPVLVGVEIKKVPDLLQSLMDKRLTGYQLPGLLKAFEVPMLLIEGIYSAAPNRNLVVWNGRGWGEPPGGLHVWKYEELEERLATLVHRAGVLVDRTPDRRGTAAWLAAQHKWWVGKPYEEHVSHMAMRLKTLHTDDPLAGFYVTTKMKVVADLVRGIGEKKARAVSDYFRSPRLILNAAVEELMKVAGIGKELAQRVYDEARKGE